MLYCTVEVLTFSAINPPLDALEGVLSLGLALRTRQSSGWRLGLLQVEESSALEQQVNQNYVAIAWGADLHSTCVCTALWCPSPIKLCFWI